MATIANSARPKGVLGEGFFLTMAIVMTVTIVAGFSLQLGMGRSTFASPLLVHAHAVTFMGWMVLYLLQNIFAANGSMALHRRLGWIGAAWIVLMIILGCLVTLRLARVGHTPFFFRPLQFLILDPISVFTFAGLTVAAIALRRQTEWHRRLHYCGMSVLMGPALGRLLPMPLLIPWAWEVDVAAVMIFPMVGILADRARTGTVHPAWRWGIGAIIGSVLLTEAITYSPIGNAIYRAVTAGTPGASVPPLEFPPRPAGPLIKGSAAST